MNDLALLVNIFNKAAFWEVVSMVDVKKHEKENRKQAEEVKPPVVEQSAQPAVEEEVEAALEAKLSFPTACVVREMKKYVARTR